MKVVALKFLRISTVPAVPSLLREAYAEQRARFVPLVMGETFRAAFDGAGERMCARWPFGRTAGRWRYWKPRMDGGWSSNGAKSGRWSDR